VIVTNPIHLTSLDNPRIKAVRRLRKQRQRRLVGCFVAEGLREVSRALEAKLVVRELYWCRGILGGDPKRLDQAQRLIAGAPPASVFTVTEALMTKMAYRQHPEGLLGIFEQPRWDLNEMGDAGDMGGHEDQMPDGSGLWLVAVGTQKPGNLGAMVRSADAAGCSGVLVADGEVDVFNPNAIRASTGVVFRLPVVAGSSQEIFSFLRSRRVRLVAASPEAKMTYTDADLTGPLAVVIGCEDRGLDPFWRAAADGRSCQGDGVEEQQGCCVSIPMRGQVADSLSASVAGATLLFEAVRQRRGA